MKFIITGKNIDITDGIRNAIEDKIGKLEKYFTSETDVYVTLGVEKERQIIEVTIPMKGHVIRTEQVSDDMYVSIDLVEEVIGRQLKKYKKKLISQKHTHSFLKQDYMDQEYQENDEIVITRTKQFEVKPMYPEDACVQMELLGHSFYMFNNAETGKICVAYRRKGNTYGLIEPEL